MLYTNNYTAVGGILTGSSAVLTSCTLSVGEVWVSVRVLVLEFTTVMSVGGSEVGRREHQ